MVVAGMPERESGFLNHTSLISVIWALKLVEPLRTRSSRNFEAGRSTWCGRYA